MKVKTQVLSKFAKQVSQPASARPPAPLSFSKEPYCTAQLHEELRELSHMQYFSSHRFQRFMKTNNTKPKVVPQII